MVLEKMIKNPLDCKDIKLVHLLGRKVMTNLDSIFKSMDIILPTKVRLVRLRFFQ